MGTEAFDRTTCSPGAHRPGERGPSVPRAFSALVLLAALLSSAPALGRTLEASYPLLTDLADESGNYGPVVLFGETTPPDPPDDGVCTNGIYALAADGQNVRTPNLAGLDDQDFRLDVDFRIPDQIRVLPNPIIVAGEAGRWVSIYVRGFLDGSHLGVRYDNGAGTAWSSVAPAPEVWHTASLRIEAGELELFLDGALILDIATGALSSGGNLDFNTNDFGSAVAYLGCLRNLRFINDATLGGLFYDGFEMGDALNWSDQAPAP